MNGYEGMCMSRGKFLKPLQVTGKIIEWIFSQFTFNILGLQKFMNGYEGMCMIFFQAHDKWQVKLLSEFL